VREREREKGSPKGLLRLYECRDYGICSNVLSNFFEGTKTTTTTTTKIKEVDDYYGRSASKDIGTRRERTLKLSTVGP